VVGDGLRQVCGVAPGMVNASPACSSTVSPGIDNSSSPLRTWRTNSTSHAREPERSSCPPTWSPGCWHDRSRRCRTSGTSCSPRGYLRDPSNTCNDISELLTAAGYRWATAHTFRHTVATLLDLAGSSAREIANHLGHKRASMTQDVYMSRHTVSERAAELLAVVH